MPDVADLADDSAWIDVEAAARRARSAPLLAAHGKCRNCTEPLPEGFRFCDASCRDDYDEREAVKKRTSR
jgi:predicted nucleic acid-binding Zn ribbon protein